MDLRARDATGEDYDRFVEFFAMLAAGHTPPPRALWASHLCRSSFFLETPGGETVAYAMCSPYGEHGDVRQVAVAAEWRKRGIGRQLMLAVAERLAAAGCTRWALEVREDNTAAIGLYHSVGLSPVRRQVVLRAGERTLRAIARQRSATAVVSPAPEVDDAHAERVLGLPPGLMARMRSLRPGVLILSLDEPSGPAPGPHGLARWLPDIAEAYGILHPFIARNVAEAGALIHSLLASDAGAANAEVEVTVEEPGVARALEAAGAVVSERLRIMTGPLPAATT
jgi:ribosomal protein S18 acetylase RimI-like enzyme